MLGITGYKETQAASFSELPKLEPGGYILKIIAVKIEENQWGQKLALQFDICEGENAGFFKKLYAATPDEWENKKWKGSMRLTIPKNTGDNEKYRRSVGYFKSQMEAFEKSNQGLHINCESDWDENILKGKIVGALFNEKEWKMNGSKGFFTQCKRFVPANDIRSGIFKIPKPDMLKEEVSNEPFDPQDRLSDFVEIPTDDDTVPF